HHVEQREWERKENRLGPALPLNDDFLMGVATDYQREVEGKRQEKMAFVNFHGKFPRELAHFDFKNVGEHTIIVDVPKGPRRITFSDKLKEHNGEYCFPDLVLALVDGTLSILIRKGEEFFIPFFP